MCFIFHGSRATSSFIFDSHSLMIRQKPKNKECPSFTVKLYGCCWIIMRESQSSTTLNITHWFMPCQNCPVEIFYFIPDKCVRICKWHIPTLYDLLRNFFRFQRKKMFSSLACFNLEISLIISRNIESERPIIYHHALVKSKNASNYRTGQLTLRCVNS